MSDTPRPVIMLVDDDKDALRHFGAVLQTAFTVRAAYGWERARQAASHPPAPQLVLLGLASAAAEENALQGLLPNAAFYRLDTPVHVPTLLTKLRQACGLPAPDEISPLTGRRALVAEDDPLLAQVLAEHLHETGIRYMVVTDGTQVLALTQRERFDWLLLDVNMPVMDGLEAARQLRARPDGAGLCLIACTGSDDAASRAACFDAGMDDFLTKPLNVQDLRAKLLHWLDPAAIRPTASMPAAPAPALLAVLDAGKLAELGQGDPQRIRKYALPFLDQLDAHQAALESSLAAGDMAALGSLAHRLKSNARWLGGLALGECYAALEAAANDGQADSCVTHVAACRPASADFSAALHRHLEQLPPGP